MKKDWSTSSVAADTLRDIKRMGKLCFLLPELSDIDTVDDLSPELKKKIGIVY